MAARPSQATTPPVDATMPNRSPQAPAPGSILRSHYDACVGCGSQHRCGLHLQVAVEEGLQVSGLLTVNEHHQGAPGLAHGGSLATALDEVMGALNWLLMTPAVTGRLEVDYGRPVPVGTTLRFRARVVGQSGRKVYCIADGRVDMPDGAVVISGRGVFVQVPLEHFQEHGRSEDVERVASAQSASPKRPWLEINP